MTNRSTNKQPTNNQQTTTSKEVKNVKEVKNEKNNTTHLSWQTSFETYKAEEKAAYEALLKNSDWINQQNRLKKYPDLNVLKTLEKAHIYWGSEAGWKYKKSQGKKTPEKINWPNTYANALGISMNQVFDRKEYSAPSKTMDELYGSN